MKTVKEEFDDDFFQLDKLVHPNNYLQNSNTNNINGLMMEAVDDEEMAEDDELVLSVSLEAAFIFLFCQSVLTNFICFSLLQFDIAPVSNDKFKCMSVTGLSNVLERTTDAEVSLRVDLAEFKIMAKLAGGLSVWTSKQTNRVLESGGFLFRFPTPSSATGGGGASSSFGGGGHSGHQHSLLHHHQQMITPLVPIASHHILTYLDREMRAVKINDSATMVHEDTVAMPIASRNKHQQLTIELKTRVYRTVHMIKAEKAGAFIDELFTRSRSSDHGSKFRQQQLEKSSEDGGDQDNTTTTTATANSTTIDTYEPYADILSCPHWQMSRLNLGDIKRLEDPDLQIQALLRKGQAMRFSEILELLDPLDSATLLNSLPTFGLLIFGNWVVKSHLLYQTDALLDSEATQQHYRDLIAARDYLLWTVVTRRGATFAELYPKFKVCCGLLFDLCFNFNFNLIFFTIHTENGRSRGDSTQADHSSRPPPAGHLCPARGCGLFANVRHDRSFVVCCVSCKI